MSSKDVSQVVPASSATSEEPTVLDNSSALAENSVPDADEVGLPKMREDNQLYYNKYLGLFRLSSPFGMPFNGSDFSETRHFSAGYIYKDLIDTENECNEAQELVEEAIQKYFLVSSEDLRSLAGPAYIEDIKAYIMPAIEPNDPTYDAIRAVITDSTLEGDTLTLTCDWYNAKGTESPNRIYTKQWASVVTIQIQSEESWKYTSNEIIDIYDPMHYAYPLFHPEEEAVQLN